jgi:sulfate/thiosulfate transport system permease protein
MRAAPTLLRRGALPGFGVSLGFTWLYLAIVLLVPLAVLLASAVRAAASVGIASLGDARTLAAFRLSFGASLAAAAAAAVGGLLVAWVLVRYQFPGRALVDALVDVPFALPTAVAGLALTAIYGPQGWVGRWFAPLGVRIAFTPLGVTIALAFVGMPFVVRTIQPVLEELPAEVEEAAAALGAGPLQIFARVVFPAIRPALLTGFALAVARALGEYGSIVFISGNLPLRTEIVPLLIVAKLEQYDHARATLLATAMLLASFSLLLAINLLQRHTRRRERAPHV